ncbi:DUF7309 domain-containing protein [Paenibacillus aquistagni]|uniref:Uncharacterized protein n=1 Tax=Paenibacillus aquistagni TaxID=1852522 RepID=A0A1X7LEL7_9BACL|nr:hypothetical protein [Paenibacillus aquistagni]SMG51702.1 hypothetical protein SAMN06295960_3285 [Paenibacillus aquistagni]
MTVKEKQPASKEQEKVWTEEQQQLSKLYETAREFKKLACWKWISDNHIFGVQNPEDGEIGYCSIMGESENLFGLALFRGSEGLESLNDMLIERDERYAWLHRQKCIMVTYEDRTDLEKRDLAEIKELGLSFRGRNAWPMFRVFDPGFVPWTLDMEQVRFMTAALEQAMDFATRVKKDASLLTAPQSGNVLVRTNESGAWEDRWMEPGFILKRPNKVMMSNQEMLNDIMNRFPNKKGHWETEFFYAPVAVKGEGERPYYPRLAIWVDRTTRSAVGFHLCYDENYEQEFLEHFLKLIEEKGHRPQKLVIRTNETLDLFEKTAQRLKVKIEREPRLVFLEEARQDLFEYFMNNQK